MPIRERWFVDGWEFTQGDVRDVEYRDGQLQLPGVRGTNAVVPNRTGQVWHPKKHDSGQFTLQMWFGTNQTEAQAAWDEILKAVVQPHRLCTYKRVTASGEARFCDGEVVGALKPTAIGQSSYRASIDVVVPGGYWRGDTLFTASTPDGAAAGLTSIDLPLTDFAASTAAMEALVLRVDGAGTIPTITDITERGRGEVVTLNATFTDGQSLTLDCGAWTITPGGGLVFPAALLGYAGDRFLTVAAPPPGVTPALRLAASTGTLDASSKLTVSGYRSYLV